MYCSERKIPNKEQINLTNVSKKHINILIMNLTDNKMKLKKKA